MGWIGELSEMMQKHKIVKVGVIFFIVICLFVIGLLAFRLGRDTYNGHDALTAGPLKLPEVKKTTTTQSNITKNTPLSLDTFKNDTSDKKSAKNAVKAKNTTVKTEPALKQVSKRDNNQNSGTNNGNMGGTGNESHTVNGTNNGINGNVRVDAQNQLTDFEKNKLSHMMDKLLIDSPNVSKCYEIEVQQNSDIGKIGQQVKDLFIEKGFSWGGEEMGSGGSQKGMRILIDREHLNCVKVIIGNMDK